MHLIFKYILIIFTLQLISSQSISSFNITSHNHTHTQLINCDLDGDELNHNLDNIRMTKTDAIMILGISPISIFCVFFVIITSFYYSKLLDSPGDIILALSINEFVKIITYIINACYFFIYDEGPLTNNSFCQLTGSLLVVANYIEDYYNIIFCLFILLRIRYILKEVKIPPFIYHGLLVLAIILMVFLLKYYGKIGKNCAGICGLKACFNSWSYAVNFIQILNIILVTLTLRYFIKNLPNYLNIRKMRAEIINYLGIYLIGQTLARIACEIFQFLLQINSYKWKSLDFRSYQFLIYFKLLITPLLLFIMRYNHLFMSNFFKKIFCCRYFYTTFLSNNNDSNDLNKNLNNSFNINNINDKSHMSLNSNSEDQLNPRSKLNSAPSHFPIKEKPAKMSLEMDCSMVIKNNNGKPADKKKNSEKNAVGFFSINIISYNMKIMLTRSILTGIWISHTSDSTQTEESKSNVIKFKHRKSHNMFLETIRIPIHDDHGNQGEEKKTMFELTMIVYAPRMFKSLLKFDKDMINFDISLDLLKNDENIKKASKMDGGKSGEFFFCTHDNKLIIKTLKSDELRIFLRSFEEYYNYLTKHKDSLITKIYGVYTFFRKDIDISNHVIIMRNIVNSTKKNIVVSYDLKGSSFDREVIKDLKNYEDRELAYERKQTLKDSDFLKFEKQIEIPGFLKERLLKNLEEDANFFKKLGFMDYSLFLVKVKKNRGLGLLVDISQNSSNALYSIESLCEPGIYYNIGIIDYFQKYTTKKFMEKMMKKLIHANTELDTSSQHPKIYSLRFMNFMNAIIK